MSTIDNETLLLISNCIGLFLFIMSEVIGYSKCSANGVFEFMFTMPCNKKKVRFHIEEIKETTTDIQ